MTKNLRLKEARIKSGMSQEEFAEKMYVKTPYVTMLENGKGFSYKKAKQMAKILGVSPEWLFFDYDDTTSTLKEADGDEYKASRKTNPRMEAKPQHLASDPTEEYKDKFTDLGDGTISMRIPIIRQRAYAGYLRGFSDPEYYEDLPTMSIDVYKEHKGTYLAFEVMGDSMTTLEPDKFRQSIFEGSFVVGRELAQHHWKYKLHTHYVDSWIIVHKTEGILVKKIIKHDVDKGVITIHSLNPDKETYPDQDIDLNDVQQIFSVVQRIDKM